MGEVPEFLRRGGLSKSSIRTDVELALRKAEIEVITNEESLQTDSKAFLAVEISALQGSGPAENIVAYSISIRVNQVATLTTGEEHPVWTYETPGSTGLAGKQRVGYIERSLMDQVEVFINDWLSVRDS